MLKRYIGELSQSIIFKNLTEDNISHVLDCLGAYQKDYRKETIILSEHDIIENIGIIVKGEITVYKTYSTDECMEARKILAFETFGHENVYTGFKESSYTLIATKNTSVIYINGHKLIEHSSIGCAFRSQMNMNMLQHISGMNLNFQNQIELRAITQLKSRILEYLKESAKGEKYFKISHNREEMARYLGASRPSVSTILMELKTEGIIDYHKNMFTFKTNNEINEEKKEKQE